MMISVLRSSQSHESSTQSLLDRKEFCARLALKDSEDNIDVARQIAESQFRKFVRRDLCYREIGEIHTLIEELCNWRTPEKCSG